jgi:lysozyme
MKVSKTSVALIKHHEGVRRKPYRCPAALWTVGVGHVLYPEQASYPSTPEGMNFRRAYNIKPEDNRDFTEEEIDAILYRDLQRFERGVRVCCPGKLTQNQFDALVSFAFNLGLGVFQRSTLRQKVNRREYKAAAEEFLKYVKAGGRVLKGLVRRRTAERALFLSE